PDDVDATAFAALVGHALGPIGAAATAYLISVIQDGISNANPWLLDDGSPAPSLADVEEVAAEPEQSTGEVDRNSFTWPVESPGGAQLVPIVAAAEHTGAASVSLTESVRSTSPVIPSSLSAGILAGSASEAPVNLTENAQATSPVNL